MLNYHQMTDIKVKKVFDSYEEELALVEESLRGLFKSKVFLVPLIGRYLIEGGGKRIRPLFLLLSSRLAGYKGNAHIELAGIIESIHTASLLHDDVIDGADIRRGRETAHSIWGNQVVILVGDFLYSNALRMAVSYKSQSIMDALSEATTRMTEGELFQLEKAGDISITEEEYMGIISSKTGILLSAACKIGGILGGLSQTHTEALASFGLKAGIAFQMADDILDYMAGQEGLGKKLGKDLDEGKITLPLIVLLAEADKEERLRIKAIVEGDVIDRGLDRILELFEKYDILKESLKKARALIDEAKAELSIFADSKERDELFALADYALERDR